MSKSTKFVVLRREPANFKRLIRHRTAEPLHLCIKLEFPYEALIILSDC